MLKNITKVFALILLFFAVASVAAPSKNTKKSKKRMKTKVSKSVQFDDLLVQGKYHFSDEAVVTVEQDKVLDALLGIRKDFKDRMKKSASRF